MWKSRARQNRATIAEAMAWLNAMTFEQLRKTARPFLDQAIKKRDGARHAYEPCSDCVIALMMRAKTGLPVDVACDSVSYLRTSYPLSWTVMEYIKAFDEHRDAVIR